MKTTIEFPDEKLHTKAFEDMKMTEVEKLNTVCFWLIKQCIDTNAEIMKVTQEKVFQFSKQLGDWKIEVKKIKPLS